LNREIGPGRAKLRAAWPPRCAENKADFAGRTGFQLFDKIVCPV
jgi:hypothetical protein